MNHQLSDAWEAASEQEQQDALRIVEAAVIMAALPGVATPLARDLASRRLREMTMNHPSAAELFAAVVTHIESY